ncbi:MAG: hypothetical protein B6229_02255 [Spirochaetaceae bacterium 4572_7]|nr:MAG: hypothetical protein B6229_02255 [Spirochaetaceae bacterium 4572_7]
MKLKSFINRILILLLIIFAGFIFWLGWEQLELKENTYGVVFTKTSGWKKKLITTENFNWSFERLIPTNYTIHKFLIEKKSMTISNKSFLPAAELYAGLSSIPSSNFEYNYSIATNVSLKKEKLISLCRNGIITQGSFENWESVKTDNMKESLDNFVKDKINRGETITLSSAARNFLSDEYPNFTIDTIIVTLELPDMPLYTSARNRYLQYIEAKIIADAEYIGESLKQENREALKLDLLKKYGEIFTQYPIMIEYLKVDSGKQLDRASITDFITLQNQR